MSEPRPLVVVALGGNAVSPPRGDPSIEAERTVVAAAAAEIAAVARAGARLLVVHGNGPQVGRLLAEPHLGGAECLDVHVAQTQGELGYLLAEGLEASLGAAAVVAIVTRVLVDANDPAFERPSKPVGTVLPRRPPEVPAVEVPGGWRRVVASPRPLSVLERDAVAALLATRHVVAGGGGGVALSEGTSGRRPSPAVVDKDWVASLLAIALGAEELLFVTDVPAAYDAFGTERQCPLGSLKAATARVLLGRGVFAPGSMAPKIESAAEFVEAGGRRAVITTVGRVAAARREEAGTIVRG
jgi:carbamate kinase